MQDVGWEFHRVENNSHVVEPEIQLPILGISQYYLALDVEVRASVGIDYCEVTRLENYRLLGAVYYETTRLLTCVLGSDVEKNQMAKLHRVDRHNAAFTKITLPVLVFIFVVNPVLQVIRQEVFQFNGSPKLHYELWELSVAHVGETTFNAALNQLT